MARTTGPQQYSGDEDREHQESLNFYVIRPEEIQPGDQFGYKIIMVVDRFKNWWAVKGLTSWSDDYTRDCGDKLSEEAALAIFPMMRHLNYAYRD